MSQQSNMADDVRSRLGEGPIPAACLVQELRSQWGFEHGAAEVHRFVQEMATCLLFYGDVEVGDLENGRFIPWQLSPEASAEKIEADLMGMDAFLEDENRYVFRKRN
jgi:hypothetical protein